MSNSPQGLQERINGRAYLTARWDLLAHWSLSGKQTQYGYRA